MPDFRGANLKDRLILAGSEHDVERAFNPVKYGRVPDRPALEIVLSDGSLSAIAQFAPHAPDDRDAARAAMLAACLAQLEVHAPGIRALVERADILMPYDIEDRHGLHGGQWHAGELSVEQMLFLRPLPGIAQCGSPIRDCGLRQPGVIPGAGFRGPQAGTPRWRWRLQNDGSSALQIAASEDAVPPPDRGREQAVVLGQLGAAIPRR